MRPTPGIEVLWEPLLRPTAFPLIIQNISKGRQDHFSGRHRVIKKLMAKTSDLKLGKFQHLMQDTGDAKICKQGQHCQVVAALPAKCFIKAIEEALTSR
jgi:hypothetical protein